MDSHVKQGAGVMVFLIGFTVLSAGLLNGSTLLVLVGLVIAAGACALMRSGKVTGEES
jgi:hypothetical protein